MSRRSASRTQPPDLLAMVGELVDIASVSHHETAIADHVEATLGGLPWLSVSRVGDAVVARTELGRPQRLGLVGHLDTVPANGNERARLEVDRCWGLGAADMKAGCAVFLALAAAVAEPAVDLTYVFYDCEEVEARFNGLRRLLADRPDLLAVDAAVLGEPTGAAVEAGCQGTLRLAVELAGQRAHTARPWTGRNAVHRLAPLLARCAAFAGRQPELDGCRFAEALQAVAVSGGVAGNVVPDRARVVLNHRFAPDRDVDEAVAAVRLALGDSVDEAAGDTVEVVDHAPGARPGLDHPLLARLVAATGAPPAAKLGWTDVAFFASRGVPATNFGPGDPSVAHTAGEHVDRAQLERVWHVLHDLVTAGA